jgi:hypothetical protein
VRVGKQPDSGGSLLGEHDPHLGLVIRRLLAAHVNKHPLDFAGELEGWSPFHAAF